jgi:LuxR family maltose regulon positive regulatory protein
MPFPRRVAWFSTSRETPPLQLESLRIRQELVVLDNEDLAFSIDEISRFYSVLYGLRLAPHQLATIRRITDGWAGGLVLVWEALSHVPEDQRIAFIDSGLPAAMHGERLAYFSEAVFSGLDEATRHFLIRSSIFETIDPKMAARYLENQPVGDVEAPLSTPWCGEICSSIRSMTQNRLGLSIQPVVPGFPAR